MNASALRGVAPAEPRPFVREQGNPRRERGFFAWHFWKAPAALPRRHATAALVVRGTVIAELLLDGESARAVRSKTFLHSGHPFGAADCAASALERIVERYANKTLDELELLRTHRGCGHRAAGGFSMDAAFAALEGRFCRLVPQT
jgi:hypothetical protein